MLWQSLGIRHRRRSGVRFGEEQIDLNMEQRKESAFEENLRWLARHGASLIRLDAFAYAVKRLGTSCFLWNGHLGTS